MSSNLTRTLYGSSLQTTQFAQLPFDMKANTTLNEKFGIQSGVAPAAGQMPKVGFYCIGNGGHAYQTGAGGIPILTVVPHVATDAALYQHLPFVLRAIGSDLTPTQQQAYALRKIITVNSLQYIAYYLKRLPTNAAVVELQIETITNGVPTITEFVPSSANLNPTPPNLGGGSNPLLSQFALCSSLLPMILTADECQELLNAATILYGDPNYAIISEMGICSGVDKTVTIEGGATFNEAIAVQICSHLATFHAITYTATGVNSNLNLGTNDPLLVVS